MKKGDMLNLMMIIGVLMLVIVFAFLWMSQQGLIKTVVNPVLEETPVLTGILVFRK